MNEDSLINLLLQAHYVSDSAERLDMKLTHVDELVFKSVIYGLIENYCQKNSSSAIKMAYDIYMTTAKMSEKGGAK